MMLDPRTSIVHRLKFLNIVQQLARADVEAAASAVGLDALASTLALAETNYSLKTTKGEEGDARNARLNAPRRRAKSGEKNDENGREFPRALSSANRLTKAPTFAFRQRSSTIKDSDTHFASASSLVNGDGDDTIFNDLGGRGVTPQTQQRTLSARGRKNPSAGLQHVQGRPAAGSSVVVDDGAIEVLRNVLLNRSGKVSPSSLSVASPPPPSSLEKPQWDNRFGVPAVISQGRLGRPPQAQPSASPVPLSETVRSTASARGLPPMTPSTPLAEPGGANDATTAQSSGPEGVGGDRSETPNQHNMSAAPGLGNSTNNLGGTARRRGSALKARPRPKAAAHGSATPLHGQVPMLPSDFTAIDEEVRRRAQNTPVGLAASAPVLQLNQPSSSSATPGMSLPSPQGIITSNTSTAQSPSKSFGGGAPASQRNNDISPRTAALTPLAMSASGAVSDFEERHGTATFGNTNNNNCSAMADTNTNNASVGSPTTAADRDDQLEKERMERIAVKRAMESAQVLSSAKEEAALAAAVEAARYEQYERQSQLLGNLSVHIDRLLSDHGAIIDKHAHQMGAAAKGGGQGGKDTKAAIDVDGVARELELMLQRKALGNGLARLQSQADTEVALELELDRIQRRLAEQEEREAASLGANTDDTQRARGGQSSAAVVGGGGGGRTKRRRGQVPASVVNKILQHKTAVQEITVYNEKLWNISTTSQYQFADRLSSVLMEDLLEEVAYGEVDVMLNEYVNGLAEHELRLA